jgi:hypothetical protein
MGSLVNSAQSSFSLFTQFKTPDPLFLVPDGVVFDVGLERTGNLRYTT